MGKAAGLITSSIRFSASSTNDNKMKQNGPDGSKSSGNPPNEDTTNTGKVQSNNIVSSGTVVGSTLPQKQAPVKPKRANLAKLILKKAEEMEKQGLEILPDNIGDDTGTSVEKSKVTNSDVVDLAPVSQQQPSESLQTTPVQHSSNPPITPPPPPQIFLSSHQLHHNQTTQSQQPIPQPRSNNQQQHQQQSNEILQPYFHRLPNGQIVLIQPYPMSTNNATQQDDNNSLNSSSLLHVDSPAINPLAFGAVASNINIQQTPAMLDAGLQKIQQSSFNAGLQNSSFIGGTGPPQMTPAQPQPPPSSMLGVGLFQQQQQSSSLGIGAGLPHNTALQSPVIGSGTSQQKTAIQPLEMMYGIGDHHQHQQQLQNPISPFSTDQTHPFRSQIMTRKMKREKQQQQQAKSSSELKTPKARNRISRPPSPVNQSHPKSPLVDSDGAVNKQQNQTQQTAKREKQRQQKPKQDETILTTSTKQINSSSSFSSLSGAESDSSLTNRLRVNSRLPAACYAPETEPITSSMGIGPPPPTSLSAGDVAAVMAMPNEPRFEPVKLDSASDSEWSINSKDDDDEESRENARQIILLMQGANQKSGNGVESSNQKEINTLYSPIKADSSLVVNKRNRNRSTRPKENETSKSDNLSKVIIILFFYIVLNLSRNTPIQNLFQKSIICSDKLDLLLISE